MDNLTDSVGLELEQNYVKSTYEDIADDFSSTRYRKWPKVESFLKNLPRFSIVLDVGCGNGKYLDNETTFNIGCDASSKLLSICRSRKFEVANCDMIGLSFRNSTFDAIICIAALHHIVSSQRRKICLENMVNLLANGDSRLLVQVWSYEQELERNNPYLNPNKIKSDKGETSPSMQVGECQIPIHKNRTPFSHQDLLVPFNVRRSQSSSSSSKEASGYKGVCCDKTQYLRYYHVFKQNELEALVAEIPNATLVESYYDKGNWCSIIKRNR